MTRRRLGLGAPGHGPGYAGPLDPVPGIMLAVDPPIYHGSAPGEAMPAMGGDRSLFCLGCEDEAAGKSTTLERHTCGLADPTGGAADSDRGGDPLPAIVPPDPAALTEAIVGAMSAVKIAYRTQLDAEQVVRDAEAIHLMNLDVLARACDAKARAIGRGNFCTIAGVVFRSAPPRKARGKPEDPGALWRLERVEVGE